MVYWNVTWLVRANDALLHRQSVVYKNWYGPNEQYCEIPVLAAQKGVALFEWIGGKNRELYTKVDKTP